MTHNQQRPSAPSYQDRVLVRLEQIAGNAGLRVSYIRWTERLVDLIAQDDDWDTAGWVRYDATERTVTVTVHCADVSNVWEWDPHGDGETVSNLFANWLEVTSPEQRSDS